ncbi:MAG: DUF177 domain-containing protein [Burkholderiaceae bacterium]
MEKQAGGRYEPYVDTFELTRLGQEVAGQAPIARFERLVGDLPRQDDTMVSWTLRGMRDARGRNFLRVHIQAAPTLECQRCLKPFQWPVDSDGRLQVVNSQAALEAEDALDVESDDLVERIVGSHRLDVLELVEDELILGLPYVPMHEVCPSPEPLSQEPDVDTARPSPFAVLGRLKKD